LAVGRLGFARIVRSEPPEVKPKVLLTGRPGCGKTTLIKRVVDELALPAGGFYTEEIRQRRGRVGFKIVTLNGEEAVLAHVTFNTTQRVGKYGLDLRVLESIGTEAICAALRARRLVVIDEIGPMEIRSPVFCDVVNDALDSPDVSGILGTITARSFPFTNAIKKRHDITLIEVRPNNREQLVLELSAKFKA
jgi:nucleoside-triphosphatase